MKSTMREADVLADSSGHRPARDAMAEPTSDLDDNGSETKAKEEKTAKLKKHPGAPKRFRTAFIIFSQQRHGELRAKLQEEGAEIDTINVARMVSDQWREMSQEDKEQWEEMAREDKARYLRQKEEYAGPWKVPADMKKPKDPTAPKKPTPAYFSFSNERRQSVKKDNPTASNGEISKILSRMWKEADEDTRTLYVEKEKAERAVYNKAVEEWKKERKESGRENWWDYDTGVTPAIDEQSGGDRKRARLDILADAAPHRGEMSAGGNFGGSVVDQVLSATSMTPLNGGAFGGGGSSSFPLSGNLQDQLSALSSQGGLQTIAALLPGLLGGGQQGANYMGVSSGGALPPLPQVDTSSAAGGGPTPNSNPQVLDALQRILGQQQQQQQPSSMGSSGRGGADQSQLGGGNAAYSSFLGGGSSSMGATGFNNMSGGGGGGNQHNLLAALLGGGSSAASGYQQELQSFHHDNSFNQGVGNGNSNVGDILSLLYRQQQPAAPPPPQPPQQQSGLHSLLQGFPGNFFSQLQSSSIDNHQQNSNSALTAFLGQQQGSSSGGVFQQASSSSAQPSGGNDQLSQSLLQSLLQQQIGGSNQALSYGSQQPSGPSSNALEEALQRLIQNQQQQH